MASAAPSSLASSVEKTNGAKLSRLLIDGGTTVLRSIFDRYHPPASLSAAFAANYLTLNNLLRRRVLHRPQWDLLFPPSGAPPDSQTFDITLLFLLLTNICGLFPPRSGWHTKPPPSDISLEANLARIKFYRNKLYGHVSTTGIATPTFSALWQEISAILVALGLHQADIDRLKAERWGEEGYTDTLLKLSDNEEDINPQSKNILVHVQTKLQQSGGDERQTQLENREAAQESKSKLEEVPQIHLGDRQILQDSKAKLDKVYEVVQITHIVTEGRQTQVEDSSANKEIRSKVKEVRESLQTLKQKFKREDERHKDDDSLKQTCKD